MDKQPTTMAQRVRLYELRNRYEIQLTEEVCTLDGYWCAGEQVRPTRLKHLLKLQRYRQRVKRVRVRG